MGGTEDLTGKVFGCLTVIKLVGRDANRNGVWECRCSCGTILNVKGQSISSGLVGHALRYGQV